MDSHHLPFSALIEIQRHLRLKLATIIIRATRELSSGMLVTGVFGLRWGASIGVTARYHRIAVAPLVVRRENSLFGEATF